MATELCLLFLIIINGLQGAVLANHSSDSIKLDISDEPTDDLIATIRSHREDFKDFFAVQTINFIVDRRSVSDPKRWLQIYESIAVEFKEDFSFSVVTEEVYSKNSTFLNKFSRRDPEVEREGFLVNFGLHDRVPVEFETRVLRDNGYYLVILDDEKIEEMEIVRNFQSAWIKTGSITMVVFYKDRFWTFNPFGNRESNSFGTLEPYQRNNGTLKYQLLRNLNGYPLKVEFFESGFNIAFYRDAAWAQSSLLDQFLGPDSVSVAILRDRMNFTAEFQTPDRPDAFGVKLDNGTFTGCLGRMINRQSDIALTGFFIKDYLSPDVEFTSAIYQDELCLISKKASRIPGSLLPLVCFEVDLWFYLFLTMILSAIVWSLVREVNRRIVDQGSINIFEFLQILVDTAMLTLSAPLRKFPVINSERSFIASICLLSLVFVSIFQSSLSTVFIKPLFYKDIMTLLDLAETKLPIYVKYAAMMQDMFPENSTGMLGQLHDQMRQIASSGSVMAQLSVAGNFVTVTRRCTTHQDNAYYFSSRMLHLIPECPRIYNLAYMTRRNSVLLDRLNEILLQLNNAGFHEKWIRDLNYKYAWLIRLKYGSFHEDAFKVLTMDNLQLPFFILGVGFSISAVVFISEWILQLWGRCKGRHY